MRKNESKKPANPVTTTVIIVLIALVCVTLATRAWFTIADNTRLSGANMGITTGKSLRFDLDEHDSFEEYSRVLTYEEIAERVFREKGIDMAADGLEPVTTADGQHFCYENGDEADPSDYIEFTLHFRSTEDMNVHLTSGNSEDGEDGTDIISENSGTPYAMRIAFITEDGTLVYDKGLGDERTPRDMMTAFGLLSADEMKYNENNVLFYITEGEDVPVTVRIWVEGNDEACTNDMKFSDYSIRMRFEGTDENYNVY